MMSHSNNNMHNPISLHQVLQLPCGVLPCHCLHTAPCFYHLGIAIHLQYKIFSTEQFKEQHVGTPFRCITSLIRQHSNEGMVSTIYKWHKLLVLFANYKERSCHNSLGQQKSSSFVQNACAIFVVVGCLIA